MKNVRFFTLCIVLAMLTALFSACKEEPGPQNPQQSELNSDSESVSDVPAEPTELILVADGKTEYRIIRPDAASIEVKDAVTELFYAFKNVRDFGF